MTKDDTYLCPICERITPFVYTEKHHLVPRCKKGKDIVRLCKNCARILHKIFSNKELQKEYNTIEKIKSDPDIQKWIAWISKKPNDFSVCMATKKRR